MNIKGYLQSRTAWGLLVLGIAQLAQWAGIPLGEVQIDGLATNVAAAVDLVGYGLAVYGTVARPDLKGLWRRVTGQ